MKPEQRSYACECGAKVILYGGRTSNTAVVCNCGKWMRIADDEDQTELLNIGMERMSGEIALKNSNSTWGKKE